MRKNLTVGIFSSFLLVGLTLSCGLFGNKSVSENSNAATVANSDKTAVSPAPSAVDCPQTTLTVNDTKDKGLDKYAGCTVSIQGKIWEVKTDVITLIDAADRTDYNYSLFIGGNFSSGTYSDIALKISNLKVNQQFDRLPVATFTGKVEKVSGYSSIKNSVLTNVQR